MDLYQSQGIIRAALETFHSTASTVRSKTGGDRGAVSRELMYARQLAERWLAAQPGHLTMSVLLTEVLLAKGHRAEAANLLRKVLGVDPENEGALALKVRLHEEDGKIEASWAAAAALQQVAPANPAGKSKLACLAAHAPALLGHEPLAGAEYLAHIPALADLEGAWRSGKVGPARELAERLLDANPTLIKAHLILADCLMALGDEGTAVDHIHQAASLDPGGEIAQRLWDGEHPYVGAWPAARVAGAPGPLPHPIASRLGLNLLAEPSGRPEPIVHELPAAGGESAAAPTTAEPLFSPVQETLVSIQAELNRLNGRSKSKPTKSARKWIRLQPFYAIVTSKTRLESKYGTDGWQDIHGALQTLVKAAGTRLGVGVGLLLVDDAASLEPYGLTAIDPADPWAVKSLLGKLDERLQTDEQEIGWLLIVGGPDIIPFHRLPNPTDDGDNDVPSDNPYGARDDNYYVPQRAVGRMPDGMPADKMPSLLLSSIGTAVAAHHASRRAEQGSWFNRLLDQLLWFFRRHQREFDASFGYSASVWRKASLSVFSKIGPARRLRISPPLTADEFSGLSLGPARYGYFNLHGIADGPAWYGQRDPTFPADYPAFPVAIRPQDVGALGCAPEVVFSEACYGALAENKRADEAMCLKFLAAGVQMFVGSTCIAYGGLNSSPEAADLLAQFFWQEIMAGRTGGLALQQAKVSFAQFLDDRQGYLDGEDQKTLISFVYYGDPTLKAPPIGYQPSVASSPKRILKELGASPAMVSAKGGDETLMVTVAPELVDEVRTRVADYLPGMDRAKIYVARQQAAQAGRPGQSPSMTAKIPARAKMVFTLQKAIQFNGHRHEQIVKVTVDDAAGDYGAQKGLPVSQLAGTRVLKLTVSK